MSHPDLDDMGRCCSDLAGGGSLSLGPCSGGTPTGLMAPAMKTGSRAFLASRALEEDSIASLPLTGGGGVRSGGVPGRGRSSSIGGGGLVMPSTVAPLLTAPMGGSSAEAAFEAFDTFCDEDELGMLNLLLVE